MNHRTTLRSLALAASLATPVFLVESGCSSGSSGGGGGPPALGAFLENESRLNTNAAGASTSEDPLVCIDGSRIYVIWRDSRTGSDRIYFNSSSNGGITWRSNDIQIPYGGTGATDLDLSSGSLACDGSNVYVVWEELVPGGEDDIYLNYSTNGGTTWLPTAIRLDTDAAGVGDSDDPVVVVDGLNVCVVWKDTRSGQRDIHLNHSADGGATWQVADTRLDTDAAGSSDSDQPRMRIQGTDVFVVWQDDRDGSRDIRLNRSSDGGATWLGADVRLDTDAAGSSDSIDPVIASSGLNVYVAWRDDREGDYDIYHNISYDGGVTWDVNDGDLDDAPSGIDSEDVQIAAEGTNVYVCYKDKRNGGDDDIFVMFSNDGGATWNPTDVRLDTGNGDSDGPRICADAGNVYVCWEDTKAGLDDVYLRYSTDAGATWIPAELYAGGVPAGTYDSSSQQISCTGNTVWMVWHEDRDGDLDVFVNGGVLP